MNSQINEPIIICAMTYSCVKSLTHILHDSLICVTWFNHKDIIFFCLKKKIILRWLSHMWHDSLICVTWFNHKWHDSFICDVTSNFIWMTHSHFFFSFEWLASADSCVFCQSYVAWQFQMWHGALVCDMSHSHTTRWCVTRHGMTFSFWWNVKRDLNT